MDKYIIHNGKFELSDKPLVDSANRALNYGDGFFESLKWHKGEVLFLSKHLERMHNAFDILHFSSGALLKGNNLEKEINKLIQKNKSGAFARVRVIVYRNAGGFYSPEKNTCSYIIQTTKSKTGEYPLYKAGKHVGVYTEVKKSRCRLSNIKSLNSLVYVLAGLHAQKNKLDDCFILNEKQKVVDAVSSSVILVKNNQLQFSPLKDGGVDSVMKHVVMSMAIQNNIKTKNKSISISDIEKADEILICNVSRGIEWVAKFGKYKYKSTIAIKFQKELNSIIS